MMNMPLLLCATGTGLVNECCTAIIRALGLPFAIPTLPYFLYILFAFYPHPHCPFSFVSTLNFILIFGDALTLLSVLL